jgi:hypothetical protein
LFTELRQRVGFITAEARGLIAADDSFILKNGVVPMTLVSRTLSHTSQKDLHPGHLNREPTLDRLSQLHGPPFGGAKC